MLRVNKLPEILRSTLVDGIEGVVLMTKEGSTLGAEFVSGERSVVWILCILCIYIDMRISLRLFVILSMFLMK